MTKRYVKKWGFEVIDTFENVTCGRHFSHRPELKKAIAVARRHGAIVLAAARDRYVRARDYDGTHESDVPTIDQYAQLLCLADGVPLTTVLPPGTRPETVRSVQSRYGQLAAGKKGGRPRKKKPCPAGAMKARRKKDLPPVTRLYQRGCGAKMIARRTGLGLDRAKYLVRRYCRELYYKAHAKSQARRRQS